MYFFSKCKQNKLPFSVSDFFVNNIFNQTSFNEEFAVSLFQHQYQYNEVYRSWCECMHINPGTVTNITQIPFLPISFFKTHVVQTRSFLPQKIFTSSGTTQTANSRHYVKDEALYKQSFITAFKAFYGNIEELCIIGLLPSYLERNGSSLVYMVDELIKESKHLQSGFYLYEFDKLKDTLQQLEAAKQTTVLIGVTFALLDFAAICQMPLQHTIVMETGGMKGKKKEATRQEVHTILQQSFGLACIHSEYGMTELLSQAYSKGEGIYQCPPWMKVLVRNEDDPLTINTAGKGVLNIIDLANQDSCAFIATDDAGIIYDNDSFEVLGRIDNSDLRGCSLLTI